VFLRPTMSSSVANRLMRQPDNWVPPIEILCKRFRGLSWGLLRSNSMETVRLTLLTVSALPKNYYSRQWFPKGDSVLPDRVRLGGRRQASIERCQNSLLLGVQPAWRMDSRVWVWKPTRGKKRVYWMVRGAIWFGAYTILILFPLVVGAIAPGNAAGKPFVLQLGVACGFVALSVISFEYALISRMSSLAAAFGQDALLQFHRLMGTLATLLVVIHIVLTTLSGYPLEWLNPFSSGTPAAMRLGAGAGCLVLLLIFTSIFRQKIRLSYSWWQVTHRFFADAIVLMALAHVLLIGGFSSSKAMRVALALYLGVLLVIRIGTRVVRPLRMWSRKWEIVENRVERGDSRTLVLKPHNHNGFTFEPGQFAWLNTGRTPIHLDRHPISFSSCAYDDKGAQIAFTIRNLGDWSGQEVPALEPGRLVWVDGPYGVFTADREQGMGYILFAGGVGITPMKCICSTLAERGDLRPVILFFASNDLEGLTFAEELRALEHRMNLKIVFVLKQPPEDWTGETGFITKQLIEKYLPPYYQRYQYFICGPPPMMDAIEDTLAELKVPPQRTHSERFDLV